MNFDFLTPEIFDLLIVLVIMLGLALAGIRLYDDLTRPLPPDEPGRYLDEDTQPHSAVPDDRDETLA
ncbi:MAG: hypothetical protein CL610_26525 [Anaerolineaceae bacterium]|nr:hypothetical protein [Anaerolineaceae bacterium]